MRSALFNALPDALVVVDESGCILLANDACMGLFGYRRDELVGAPVEKLIPEALRERHVQHRVRYSERPRERSMGAAEMELVGEASDGRRFPVEIALKPLRIGGARRVMASIRDVSATHLARRMARRARYDAATVRIGQLVVHGPDGDERDRITAILAETLGTGPLALYECVEPGPRLRLVAGVAFLSRDWLECNGGPLCAHLAAGTRVLEPRTLPPGVTMPAGMLSGIAVPWGDTGSGVAGVVLAFSREQGRFDHDAVHFVDTAASLVGAMSQRLAAREQLAHSQRLDAIGRLTGGVAHDFNNLLTVVAGNLQLLEENVAGDADAMDLIDSALRAVDRGAGLTRKLLSFAGRQHLRPRAVDLATLLCDLGRLMLATLGERILLRVDVPPGLPAVYADPALLDSALLNLVINARDAIEGAGMVTISVRLDPGWTRRASDSPKDCTSLAIAIEDTGSGISDEVRPHIFEPFFTTKSDGRGTGLGLSMVYGFAQQSGGSVRVDSEVGRGTRVTLTLPAAPAGRPSAVSGVEGPVPGGNETVLVVEDDEAVRRVVAASLRLLGYGVIEAADADAALAHLWATPGIDMLFSDIGLDDGMTGDELARVARAARPDLKVLLTSGYEDEVERREAAGFTLLAKPYGREELAAALRRELDRDCAGIPGR